MNGEKGDGGRARLGKRDGDGEKKRSLALCAGFPVQGPESGP